MINEIVLYQPNDISTKLEVRVEDETVWLSQQQMTTLFNQTKQNISLHINNCFKERELKESTTVKEYLTVQKEGRRTVKRNIKYYNLDVIISVGYRIKSKQGTQFRIWATRILKDYLLKGHVLNSRMNELTEHVNYLHDKVVEIDLQINTHHIPTQGVFFDGQVFDAYALASKIIRSAKSSIVLIDNYIDEITLTHLAKKNKNVAVYLRTKTVTQQLKLDVQKANAQYGNFELKPFAKSHDRFLIIDRKDVYHLGASLKDLGKKRFAFSKLHKASVRTMLTAI
jgi:hypothetical protein